MINIVLIYILWEKVIRVLKIKEKNWVYKDRLRLKGKVVLGYDRNDDIEVKIWRK